MHHPSIIRLSALLFITCLAAPLTAAENTIQLDDVWARATAPGSPNGAGYLVITNHSEQTQTLTGASMDGTERVEIHLSSEQDGMARMERVRGGIPVAPHDSVTLAPKGYHLMLLNLDKPLVAGDEHSLTLTLEPAGDITTTLEVRPHDSDAGGSGTDHHHHH
ncbi:MAG: copper chaperone PCu(A)C [Halomonadaceae bacterium]|nr:MAG: copper chaperone PCu(A)C [Halomonadaceae bacterium]